MLHNKRLILKNLIAFGIVGIFSACGGGGGGGDDGPVFNPEVAPYDVQVVGGDGGGDSSELGNTISWAYDEAATGHIVYWDTDPNGLFSQQVTDSDDGRDYTIHSLPDEMAGETYYYKVVATAGVQVSVPSEVVSGTPQLAISENSLNDVAWNGLPVDGSTAAAVVAVGDSGVIQYSPNGTLDGWTLLVHDRTVESLSGVTWGNGQFLVVGASGTILTSTDGLDWTLQDSGVRTDLEDVAWSPFTTEYIVVGKNGAILTGNATGDAWTVQASGIDTAITLEGVAVGNDIEGNEIIVAAGTHGTIITSLDGGVNWQPIDLAAQGILNNNNDLSDVTWDGANFGVVGSDSTILSSADGLNWIEHVPSIPDYSLEGAVQWDATLPADPILAAVGSAGSFIYSADEVTGYNVPTGTNEQLEAIIWVDIVDDGIDPYFLMVGHDGTVLTSQIIPD